MSRTERDMDGARKALGHAVANGANVLASWAASGPVARSPAGMLADLEAVESWLRATRRFLEASR